MEIFTSFLTSLMNLSPIIGLLLIAIYHQHKRITNLEAKKDELNKFIQEEGVKNINIISSLNNTIDKLNESAEDNHERLKEWISLYLKNK